MNNVILDLKNFKTLICPKINISHNYQNCFFYHSYTDKRRNKIDYYKNICKYYDKNKDTNKICPLNDSCNFCHNNFELHYHPLNYKKRFCINLNNCKSNKYCSFAHNINEIKIELIHLYKFDFSFFLFKYKSQFCPLPIKMKHDKNNCVYAHNYQDFKRPYSPYFINKECNNWRKKVFWEYDQQCSKGFSCDKMHGWKEIYYNPSAKTIKINNLANNYYRNILRKIKLDNNFTFGCKKRNNIQIVDN